MNSSICDLVICDIAVHQTTHLVNYDYFNPNEDKLAEINPNIPIILSNIVFQYR